MSDFRTTKVLIVSPYPFCYQYLIFHLSNYTHSLHEQGLLPLVQGDNVILTLLRGVLLAWPPYLYFKEALY